MSGGEAAAEDKGVPVGGEFQAAAGVAGSAFPPRQRCHSAIWERSARLLAAAESGEGGANPFKTTRQRQFIHCAPMERRANCRLVANPANAAL